MKVSTNNYQFLAGGGEMGKLTSHKDWSETSIGNPDTWPQSLRTTLGIILHSKFPMFLWWGPELICFYNDAYRPSLGIEGKHPSILGQPAKEAWPEIWDFIKPLIDGVLNGGEAVWREDQLVPIFRNGKMEDVYWTFSYSPVNDESGQAAGVLVTCFETTQKIKIFHEIKEREDQINFTINAAELGTWDLNPKTNKFVGNNRLKEWFGLKPDDEIELPLALNNILERDRENVAKAIQSALQPESGGNYHIQYTISNPLTKKEHIVLAKGKALFDENNTAYRFSGTLQDITQQALAQKKTEESEKRFRETVQQAPLGITIFRGPQFVVEMANDTYLQLVDRKESDFLGKPLFDSLPEVRETVEPLLTGVLKTGKPFRASEFPVILNRYGQREQTYFNLVYHPLREDNGDISGIIVVATDVTSSVNSKQALAESEKQFRNMVIQSPVPMTIFRGKDYVIEVANNAMLKNIWHKKKEDVFGKKILDVFPELNEQKYPELLDKVTQSGEIYREIESLVYVNGDKGLKKFYIDYEYAPLFESDKTVSGILITVNDVTEKVETRRKIEEAEERLRVATDTTGIATWDLDLEARTIIHSSQLAEIFGHDKLKLLTHADMRSQVHPDDLQQVLEPAFRTALKTGVYKYEARVIKPDNSICWIRAHGKVFYNKNKEPVKVIGTLRDITEEKQYQQELLESEQKFRLLADSMPQFIWTGDAEGNLNYFSNSVYNYTGLTPERINKEGWIQIVHPSEREENIKRWLYSVETGEEFIYEHRFRRHDGKYRWQLSRATPQKNEAGHIQMWVGTSTDIEDQKIFTRELKKQVDARTKELKQLNEELIKSEERYHLMVDEIQDYAIIYLNKEGIIENWNRGAEKIKGYRADEIVGKHFSVFYTAEDSQNNLPKKLLELALTIGKAQHEGWRVRKDSSLFWASVVITAVHDEQKNVIGFSKVTHDLTEKKQANDKIKANAEQLELKNKELEKMNAELQSFAYVSSHDLQEPLRKIQTFATRILEKEHQNLSDNGKNYFHRMQESANKMQTLIEDLLAYSRTNTTENIFKNTDLTEIINEVQNDFKEVLSEKNATIEVGNMQEAIIIPFQFRQLIQNLIGNSLKFSKPEVPAHIIITSEIKKGSDLNNELLVSENMYCHLSIADNGIGFEPQYKDRIFEVFQRLHGKAEYKGTGIGLAIVKKIVENHNGIITANGELNKGATFDIYIPSP